jgi:hypothetical protein
MWPRKKRENPENPQTVDAEVIPLNEKAEEYLATQSVEKKGFWLKLLGKFSPDSQKTTNVVKVKKRSKKGTTGKSETDRGYEMPTHFDDFSHSLLTSGDRTKDERVEKVVGTVFSFRVWQRKINLHKGCLKTNSRFHLPFIVDGQVINVYCDPENLFLPTQEEVEKNKKNAVPDCEGINSERINIVADDISQARKELAINLSRKREKAFSNFLTSGVVDELDRIDRSYEEEEAALKKEEVINNRIRIRKEFIQDVITIDTLSSLKEDVVICHSLIPDKLPITSSLASFLSIVDDCRSFVRLFYSSSLVYEKADNLKGKMSRELRLLSYDPSKIGDEMKFEELKQLVTKLIDSLSELLNVLYKYYLIAKVSAYQEIPEGFVEVTAGPGLYKDPFAFFCCASDNPSWAWGKCCLNSTSSDEGSSCFQHFRDIFNNFDRSKLSW